MTKRVTIRDVAKASGYSIATVSMVLNNKEVSIPMATRDKVRTVAKQLKYRPNSLAVGLITKQTRILGLVIPDNRSLLFASLSRVIEAGAHRAGYTLIYGNSGNVMERDSEYLEAFLARQVDGIILSMSYINEEGDAQEILNLLESTSVPVVALDRTIPNAGMPTVQMNHVKAGYIATRHLLELGHTRIGYCISTGYITSRMEREEGHKMALQEFGVPFDEKMEFSISYEEKHNDQDFQRILDAGATALLATNDAMVLEFYRFAQRAGVRIPEDISVVGSDDLLYADMLSPPLTTIRQPVQEIGEAAITTLLTLIEEKNMPSKPALQQFEPQLIVRGSTAQYVAK